MLSIEITIYHIMFWVYIRIIYEKLIDNNYFEI